MQIWFYIKFSHIFCGRKKIIVEVDADVCSP